MELMLNKMRADFEMVAKARRESGEWSEADVKEFNGAIKQVLDSGDTAALALWARWLADLSAGVVFYNLVVKGAEAGMRAKAAEQKARAGQ